MTGRTHDLAAFTSLSWAFITLPPESMTLATLVTCLGANFIGALYPDLDNASADLWKKVRGGHWLGKLIAPLLGGHRMITHSLVGLVVTGWLLSKLLMIVGGVLLVDMSLVWWAFMIGYVSHVFTDSLTKEGVPLFFPLPWDVGVPPIKALRVTTGARMEKFVVYPGLLLLTGYLYYQNYPQVLAFLQHQLH